MEDNNDGTTPLPDRLSNPARRAFEAAGITSLDQITRWAKADLLDLHGVGPKTIPALREALDEKGWKFADDK